MDNVIYEPKGKAREYSRWAVRSLYEGCAHNCSYCYAPAVLHMPRDKFERPTARKNILERIEASAAKLDSGGERILLCFTTDCYQPLDVELKLTRQALQILHRYGHVVQVLTKGGSYALRDLDLYGPGDAFATTLTLLDPDQSRVWEPSAASPQNRIETIRRFHEAGVETWVSLEPVLDPAAALEIIRQTAPFVDLFKVGKLNYHPLAKQIDWQAFGQQAIALLEALGKAYYIKHDLKECL